MEKVGGLDDVVWTQPPDDVAQAGRPNRLRRIAVLSFLVIIGVGVLSPLGAAVLSRKDYGTFAFWKLPDRIDYCGRRYDDGGTQQGTPASFGSRDSDADAHWSRVSWTFSGRSIDADSAPPSSPGSVCTMMLYIPLGGGRWETYALSGGP